MTIMSSQPHLQMINPALNTGSDGSNFRLFPLLPKELRLKVWQCAIQRQRFLRLRVKSPRFCNPENQPKSVGKDCRFIAFIEGYHPLSELSKVNHESREETLKFYRVRFPCRFVETAVGGRETMRDGTFYFNPEHDYLHISPEWSVKDTLFEFLYRLKHTYDPHHVGLTNLVLDLNSLNANDLAMSQPSDLEPEVRTAFTETLTQLREVFFTSTPRAGRQVCGLISGLPTSDKFFNRSFPIMVKPSSFERLQHDPRLIAEDLKRVHVGMSDPRHAVQLWFQLLEKWHVFPQHIQYRFMLGFEPFQVPENRDSAERFLSFEDDRWTNPYASESDECFFGGKEKTKDLRWPIGATLEEYDAEDKEKLVKPAFGFWLFPMGAIGPMQEDGVPEDEGFRHRAKAILDLTKHWPELALFNFP